MNLFSAPPLRMSLGAEAGGFDVLQVSSLDGRVALYSRKSSGLPAWAYASATDPLTLRSVEIWLYLEMQGIPIYSVERMQWTNVSRYVSQSADAADATMIETVDVSKGKVLQSGRVLFAYDAFDVSEVALDMKASASPIVHVRAAKGLASVSFSPIEIRDSLASKSGLGLLPQETKDLPTPPVFIHVPAELPKTAQAASKPFPTGKWVVGGLVMGGLLWSLGRRP